MGEMEQIIAMMRGGQGGQQSMGSRNGDGSYGSIASDRAGSVTPFGTGSPFSGSAMGRPMRPAGGQPMPGNVGLGAGGGMGGNFLGGPSSEPHGDAFWGSNVSDAGNSAGWGSQGPQSIGASMGPQPTGAERNYFGGAPMPRGGLGGGMGGGQGMGGLMQALMQMLGQRGGMGGGMQRPPMRDNMQQRPAMGGEQSLANVARPRGPMRGSY